MAYSYCPYCLTAAVDGPFCSGCGNSPQSYKPEPHHFPAGQMLAGRYYVGRVLGEGGFGITYLGLDTKLKRRVAIKEYFPRTLVRRDASATRAVTCYTGSAEYFERGRAHFLEEAQTLARLDDIGEIVHVLDFFPENNSAYIVMEFLEGTTLKELIAKQGRLEFGQLLEMLGPVLQAMDSMHRSGLIHRDISPDNLMLLKRNGRVKLMDFGCAREIGIGHTMTVMLKPGFAPMEQSTGHAQGPWTDVYAISATLYYCLTGVVPVEAMHRLGHDELVAPTRLGANLQPWQEQALLKGMAVEPANRWQSVGELHDALRGLLPVTASTSNAAATMVTMPVYSATIPAYEAEQPAASEQPVYSATIPAYEAEQPAVSEEPVYSATIPAYEAGQPAVSEEPVYSATIPAYEAEQPAASEQPANSAISPAYEADGQARPAVPVAVKMDPAVENNEDPLQKKNEDKGPIGGGRKKKLLIIGLCVLLALCAFGLFWVLHPHAYGEWTTLEAADCLNAGVKERRCFCGDVDSQIIPCPGHAEVKSSEVMATCTEDGMTEGMICSRCGEVLVEKKVIKAKGHQVVKDEAIEATCSVEGRTDGYHCEVCDEVIVPTQVIPKLEHTVVKDKAVKATCAKEGKTAGSHCKVCKEVIKAQEVVPKLEHTVVKDKAVKATCTKEGLTEGSHCKVCEEVIVAQEKVAKTAHKKQNVKAKSATCTEAGYTAGVRCSVCDAVISGCETKKALGHKFSGNSCTRCDKPKWYAKVSTKKSSYSKNERVDITVYVYTNESGARMTPYYKWSIGDKSGSDAWDKKYSSGTRLGVYWEKGLYRAGTLYFTVYSEEGYKIGSISVKITE